VIGSVDEVTQKEQAVAIIAFDPNYLTQPWMFHYIWRLSEIGLLSSTQGPEIKTKSSVYRAVFPHDGKYQLGVVAVDRYGNRSDPKDINFKVALPKLNSFWDTLVSTWPIAVAAVSAQHPLQFGRPARTAMTLAKLARRFRCPVHGAFVERLNGARFRMVLQPALDLMLSSRHMGAKEALEAGLIDRIAKTSPDQLKRIEKLIAEGG